MQNFSTIGCREVLQIKGSRFVAENHKQTEIIKQTSEVNISIIKI